MNVIEKFSCSKKEGQDYNEDALYIGQRFIAVIDGVTSKTAMPTGTDISGGRFAAHKVAELLESVPDITEAYDIIKWLNDNLKKCITESVFANTTEPPAASVVLYDSKTNKIISYGDCQILFREKVHKREKELDIIYAEKRAKILYECLQNGHTQESLLKNDIGRKSIEPDVLDTFLKYANNNELYGFPVLGTGNIIPDFIDEYEVLQGEEIVLASDGYPVLKPTLFESEKELARIIRDDPLLIKDYKSTKGVTIGNNSYDDRTYIRFTI